MTRVYVSIGSNVEPARHVHIALDALRERYGELVVSPVYRTAAVGFDGDDFLNLVVGFETADGIRQVDAVLDAIESSAGRDRAAPRFAPRTLDLDLLLFGDAVLDDDGIRVPRREITEYAFMLRPLADIASQLQHPVLGRSMVELLHAREFADQRCERIDFKADSNSAHGDA